MMTKAMQNAERLAKQSLNADGYDHGDYHRDDNGHDGHEHAGRHDDGGGPYRN